MNDQLQAQVTTILKQFSDGISTVGDVVIKELPDIAQQYIVYGYYRGIFDIFTSLICLVALIIAAFLIIRWAIRTDNVEASFFAFLPIFMMVPFLGGFTESTKNLILNITAPKLWLLLEIKNLIS